MAELTGLNVVVTRPAHQAKQLCELIETRGGNAIAFPVLEIVSKTDAELLCIVQHLNDYDLAIFISANAVHYALQIVKAQGEWPHNLQIAAVGRATAAALTDCGCRVDFFPAEKFDSESLLALDAMQKVRGKNIVIFRGEGGRELLAQSLRERGANVDYAECYQRRRPQLDPHSLLDRWLQHMLDIIVVTSGEGLHNLLAMVGEAGREFLVNTPLLVVSDRMLELARSLGFNADVLVAANASDEQVIVALINWAQRR